MSIFRMLVCIAQKIERIQRSFLLGDDLVKRKVHAINWELVCQSNVRGGLGIGRMCVKNKALLAKWVWRFDNEDSLLWRMMITARYGLDDKSLFWRGSNAKSASHFVKAVACLFNSGSRSEGLLKEGIRVVLGDGSRISF